MMNDILAYCRQLWMLRSELDHSENQLNQSTWSKYRNREFRFEYFVCLQTIHRLNASQNCVTNCGWQSKWQLSLCVRLMFDVSQITVTQWHVIFASTKIFVSQTNFQNSINSIFTIFASQKSTTKWFVSQNYLFTLVDWAGSERDFIYFRFSSQPLYSRESGKVCHSSIIISWE